MLVSTCMCVCLCVSNANRDAIKPHITMAWCAFIACTACGAVAFEIAITSLVQQREVALHNGGRWTFRSPCGSTQVTKRSEQRTTTRHEPPTFSR